MSFTPEVVQVINFLERAPIGARAHDHVGDEWTKLSDGQWEWAGGPLREYSRELVGIFGPVEYTPPAYVSLIPDPAASRIFVLDVEGLDALPLGSVVVLGLEGYEFQHADNEDHRFKAFADTEDGWSRYTSRWVRAAGGYEMTRGLVEQGWIAEVLFLP